MLNGTQCLINALCVGNFTLARTVDPLRLPESQHPWQDLVTFFSGTLKSTRMTTRFPFRGTSAIPSLYMAEADRFIVMHEIGCLVEQWTMKAAGRGGVLRRRQEGGKVMSMAVGGRRKGTGRLQLGVL